MLKKMCVIYKRGGVMAAARILAPDEKAARKVFYSGRLNLCEGCGTEIVAVEEYKKQHDELLEAGKRPRKAV
jgi:hypothetical protein